MALTTMERAAHAVAAAVFVNRARRRIQKIRDLMTVGHRPLINLEMSRLEQDVDEAVANYVAAKS